VAASLVGAIPAAQAQSSDALIDKLVEKGLLTVDEANSLRDEADKDFAKAHSVKTGLPDWVSSLRFNGDLRGRYEGFFSSNPSFVDRNRARYRLRFGSTAVIQDDFEVGFRLASGEPSGAFGGDPVSGNTTFSANGSKKFVYIDLAYAKWNPVHDQTWSVTTTVGKMENPFTFPSTLVFDKDFTPEGLSQEFGYAINDNQKLKWVSGGYAINEIGGSSHDPYLAASQLHLDSTWSKKIKSSAGIGVFAALAGNIVPNKSSLATDQIPDQQRGNTRDALGNPVAHFNPIYADASVTYLVDSFPLYTGAFPITVSGDFLHNPAYSKDNEGYTAGVTFGKSGKKKTWEVSYRYTALQSDAWFEEFTESDFGAFYEGTPVGGKSGYGAGTNVRGHTIKAGYSFNDAVTLNLTKKQKRKKKTKKRCS